MSRAEFWDSTLWEVNESIRAHGRNVEQFAQVARLAAWETSRLSHYSRKLPPARAFILGEADAPATLTEDEASDRQAQLERAAAIVGRPILREVPPCE